MAPNLNDELDRANILAAYWTADSTTVRSGRFGGTRSDRTGGRCPGGPSVGRSGRGHCDPRTVTDVGVLSPCVYLPAPEVDQALLSGDDRRQVTASHGGRVFRGVRGPHYAWPHGRRTRKC